MRIVIAPDKFKGCLSAGEVAAAMREGVLRARGDAELSLCPMADGGEGTVEAMVSATRGRVLSERVMGPLPHMRVEAMFGVLGDGQTAVIEMAAASGMALLRPEERDPMRTTTFGTGELLMAAARMGVKRIILGIGGSATVDAGLGCAQASGAPIVLEGGEMAGATAPLTGRDIDRVAQVKVGRGSALEGVEIEVACDVTNPLYGPQGAAPVFGPQKGATAEQVRELDGALRRLAERLGKVEVATTRGAGAAGGLGFGMMAFFGASLRPGVELVIEAVGLRERLAGADLCITGEGRFDAQSLGGKTCIGVARVCREMGVPCVVLAGSVEEGDGRAAREQGVRACFSICPGPMGLEEAMREARGLLRRAAENAVALVDSC